MLKAAVTIYNNGNAESDWARLEAYAQGVRGTGEVRKMRAYVASTSGGSATSPAIAAAPTSPLARQAMPRAYVEPPSWLQFNDGGHWLAHGDDGSRTALASAPVDSAAYNNAKVMRARKWKASPLSRAAAMQAWQADRAIALVPASLYILILDVDQPRAYVTGWLMGELSERLGGTLDIYVGATRKGYHIMLPTSLMLGNGTFTIGNASGDIRSVDGYVVVHEPHYIDAIKECYDAPLLPADAVYKALQELINARV